MALIRPRLTDFHDLPLGQEDVDFAIPFLDEDIPLCLDPFLLWKSPSMQDNALHGAMLEAFNHLGYLVNKGDAAKATEILIRASECSEAGLGFSGTRQGHRLGANAAEQVLSLFRLIPQVRDHGFTHIEEAQLYIDQIGKDRISDIACNFLKSFLIDFTISACKKHDVPISDVSVDNVYDIKQRAFVDGEKVALPVNPENGRPTLLIPKRWLRRVTWINCDDYTQGYYVKEVLKDETAQPTRPEVLNFNRQNYNIVRAYVQAKERTQADCRNDPLFTPIPVLSARRKFAQIRRLPSGKTDNADKQYEVAICQLFASLFYPHLDFAADQVRNDSGTQIRDLIFYNNRSQDFLRDIHTDYDTRQIVLELKNVAEINRDHINQLNRYLANEFGRFGVLVTRNRLPRAMFKNTIDLWAGQRRCILAISDEELELMVNVFESKQRLPIEVLKAKYVEFTRACPS